MRVRGFAAATPCWASLATTDAAGAVTFYGGLFGWRAADDAEFPFFELGDRAVAGLSPGAPAAAWVTYLSTEDMEATIAGVTGAGGSVLVPPAVVDGRGRRAILADSQGAVFGIWQRGGFNGAQVISEPGAVCWSELNCPDEDAATHFYAGAFGWQSRPGEIAEGLDYVEWLSAGRVVAGMVVLADVPPHWRTIIEVDECVAIAERCAELGGQVVFGPLDIGVGTYAQLVDPQGGSFAVIELIPSLRT